MLTHQSASSKLPNEHICSPHTRRSEHPCSLHVGLLTARGPVSVVLAVRFQCAYSTLPQRASLLVDHSFKVLTARCPPNSLLCTPLLFTLRPVRRPSSILVRCMPASVQHIDQQTWCPLLVFFMEAIFNHHDRAGCPTQSLSPTKWGAKTPRRVRRRSGW